MCCCLWCMIPVTFTCVFSVKRWLMCGRGPGVTSLNGMDQVNRMEAKVINIVINITHYRLPEAHNTKIQKQVTEMLEDEERKTPAQTYDSPMILVPKKAEDGSVKIGSPKFVAKNVLNRLD